MTMFTRYGRWAFASIGAASAAIVVAKCASRMDESTSTGTNNGKVIIQPPDFAPRSVWDSNWDR